MTDETRQPEKEFRCGGISASIWRNDVEKDGRVVVRRSVRIEKRYRDPSGEWKTAKSWFPEELSKLRLVVDKAIEYCLLTESADPEMPT